MAITGGFPRIPIQNGCKECGANLLFVADLLILEEVFDKWHGNAKSVYANIISMPPYSRCTPFLG